ncbi:hypothetical protein A2U01_0098262, partial [Trifolium medium]|nr:hypothetical protein [Trifolium medium]
GEDCLYFINTYSGHLATDVELVNTPARAKRYGLEARICMVDDPIRT